MIPSFTDTKVWKGMGLCANMFHWFLQTIKIVLRWLNI